jgi:hypothetical protein
MDHADALERLADAAVAARGSERLALGDSLEPSLGAHVDGCTACQAEVAAWSLAARALVGATPDTQGLPASARERILQAVVSTGVPRGRAATTNPSAIEVVRGDVIGGPEGIHLGRRARPSGPTPVPFRRLALAAAAVLAVFVAGALLGGPLGVSPRDKGAAELAAAITASNGILQQPAHREAVLVRSDGSRAGSVLVDPTSGQIVVMSSQDDAANAEEYHCYLVRDGQPGVWIGPMHTEEGASFWAGWVRNVADLGRPGDVIQVVDGGEAPELTATF